MNNYSTYFTSYSIGMDIYKEVESICSAYGKRIFLLGGETALQRGEGVLKEAIKATRLEIVETAVYGKDCTIANIEKWAEYVSHLKVDMIFGMGGGKALDTAKAVANKLNLPIFTFPTIASTCAATTALSVVYKDDGDFDRFEFFERPAQHSFIELGMIAEAPVKYLRAGMGDTIGKYFECHLASRNDRLEHSSLLGRTISNNCYFPVIEHGVKAYEDCMHHEVSYELEQVVLANIVTTGMVSVLVVDDYNCAIAHSVYYGLVLLEGFEEKYLHGDVVAYGVLVQLAVDNKLVELEEVRAFMRKLNMPTTLKEMEVVLNRDALEEVLEEIVNGPDMLHLPYKVSKEMIYEAMKKVEEGDIHG